MRFLIIKYMKDASGKFKEQSQVANTVRNKDWDTAAVILDYREQKVLKAVIDGRTLPKSFQRFDSYYREFFPAAVDSLRKFNRIPEAETSDGS